MVGISTFLMRFSVNQDPSLLIGNSAGEAGFTHAHSAAVMRLSMMSEAVSKRIGGRFVRYHDNHAGGLSRTLGKCLKNPDYLMATYNHIG